MVTLNSLNTIIDDILLELRNNNISESENVSRIQIEQWITQYRAMLIKQDIDKGRDLNPDYIQSIENIHLSQVDFSSSSTLRTNQIRYRTDIEIPNTYLINQLDTLEKALTYQHQTNLTQTNNDLPFEITTEMFLNMNDILSTLNARVTLLEE